MAAIGPRLRKILEFHSWHLISLTKQECGNPRGSLRTHIYAPQGRGGRMATCTSTCIAYLHIGKVDPIEICQHLADLGGVLQHGPGCLSQMVERCVSTQSLGECHNWTDLRGGEEGLKASDPKYIDYSHTDILDVHKYNPDWVDITSPATSYKCLQLFAELPANPKHMGWVTDAYLAEHVRRKHKHSCCPRGQPSLHSAHALT